MLTFTLALVLFLATVFVSPQAAAQDTQPVEITITDLSTPVLNLSDPDQEVTIRGRVRNGGDEELRYLAIHFWRSVEPITTSAELAEILRSPASVPIGSRLTTEFTENFKLITEGDEPFLPGEERTFEVRATVEELGFTQDDAAYLLGVQVRVVQRETIGRARLLVAATQQQLPQADVVQLSTTPTRTANGDFLSNDLAEQLSGELMELTRGAQELGATVLLDPALVAEVQALTSPHTVDGEMVPPVPEAAEWLAAIENLIADGDVLRLPYGDPHLARLDEVGRLGEFLELAEQQVPPDYAELPLAAQLGDAASSAILSELADHGVDVVFSSNAASGRVGDLSVVALTDLYLPGLGPEPTDDTAAGRLGRRLAEQLLAASTPVHLIRTVADLEVAGTAGDQLRQVAPPLLTGAVELTSGSRPDPWPELLAEIDGLRSHADFVADLTGIDETDDLKWAALTSTSTAWTNQADAIAFLRETPLAQSDPGDVTINAVGQFVMGSRTNDFPITIVNGMEEPVRVRLRFSSDVPQRISVPATDLVDIDAGASQTLNIAPVATSNGVVRVTAQLETEGGIPFGEEVPIQITATDLGRVGWIIIIVSGAVVLGGTFLRIRAVRAEQAKESSEQSGK